jgi:hypothetical protein
MKKGIAFFILVSGIIALFSCKKESSSTGVPKAIVESYLAPGNSVKVLVSNEILYASSDTLDAPENLDISISCNGEISHLISNGSGNYISDTSFHIIEGNTYNLEFSYNNSVISSSTTIPAKPSNFKTSVSSVTVQQFDPGSTTMPTFPEPVELTWDNPNHDYYIIVVDNIETTLVPTDTVNTDNRPIFRTQPTQSNTYKIQPMQFKYYGMHNIILYKINAEYAALYNDNGSNSLNLTSPISNITNGFGIFTGINADTLQVNVVD